MSVTNDDAERAVILILRDVTATIGVGQEEVVRFTASHHRQYCDDYDTYVGQVAEDVQQYFHDTYISSTWPTCPRHPNHPMWISSNSDGLNWYCERDGEAIAKVGELGSIGGPETTG
jgi:hypothetical protein